MGVAIGSLLCAKISGRQVEPGLIPFGAIGLTLFSADLFFASTSYQLAERVSKRSNATAVFKPQWRCAEYLSI